MQKRIATIAFLFLSLMLRADIKVFTFVDLNNDGIRESAEPLITGLMVSAYDAHGNEFAFLDDGAGMHQLPGGVVNGRLRIVITGFNAYDLRQGKKSPTSVFFGKDGDEFAIPVLTELPLDPTSNNILIPCYEQGGSISKNDSPAFVRFPFSAQGVAEMFGGDGPNPTKDATVGQIGSTWGVAYQRSNQRAFASTILKRHVGLGPQGPGAIYTIDYSNEEPTIDYFNLQGIVPSIGPAIDLGTVRREIVDTEIDKTMPYALSTIEDRTKRASYDLDAFDKVGKMAYGSIEMAEDGRTLWIVNLKQRSLIEMDVAEKSLIPRKEILRHYELDNLPGIPDLNFRFRRSINTGGNTNIGGSEAFTDSNRVAWDKNRYSVGGEFAFKNFKVSNTMNASDNTSTGDLYRTYRKGDFEYKIPVPVDETYEVILHFAEPDVLVAGDRIFDIMNGNAVLKEHFDVVEYAGGAQKAAVLKLKVVAKDGMINLKFVSKFGLKRKEAILSGFQVIGTSITETGILRPWGISFHQGRGYLGVISDASYSQSRDHLFAYLLSFDPENITLGFKEEFAFPLNYPRERASNAHLKDQEPLRSAAWEPWVETWEGTMIPTQGEPLNIQNSLLCAYAQPIFSKISFTSDGSIILGLMDRWGHQIGHNNFSTLLDERTLLIGYACGDILKAFSESDGNYDLEKTNSDDGIYYRNDDGPSYNGEFFFEDNYISSLSHHGEVITGGMLILPGSDEIAATVANPRVTKIPYFEYEGIFTQGLHFYNTNTGRRTRDFLFVDQFILGKANGLGDMTLAIAAVPPSVGNYVWCDANANGIQDPTEFGIDDIRIFLQDAENSLEMVDEQVTVNRGQYFFADLLPNHCYEMKISLDELVARGFSGSTAPLNAADSLIDSDANDTIQPGWAIITFCTGNDGLNRDDLDFGFLGPEALNGIMLLCEDSNILPADIACADFPLSEVRALASEVPNTNVRLYPSLNDADSMLNEIVTTLRVCGPDSTIFARVMVNGDPQCHSISEILLVVEPGIDGAPVHFTELICPTDPFNLLLYLQEQGFRGDVTSEFYTDPMFTMMFVGNPAAVDVMGTLPLTLYYDDTLVAGGCGVMGSVTLQVIPTATVFAGLDTTICGLSCVDLTAIGAVFNPNGSGAMHAAWSSSGTGTFTNDNTYAFARQYCVSPEDLEAGYVILTLTVLDAPCISPSTASSLVITITNSPPMEIPGPKDTIDCYHPFVVDPATNDTFPGCRLLVNCVDTLVGQVVDYDYLVGDCQDIVLRIKRTLKFTFDQQDYFCMDTIAVRGLPATLICPPEKDSVYCVPGYLKDENGHPSPLVTGVPLADSIPLWPQPPSACDILVHYKDLLFPGQCPMTIRREWFIKNTCTGSLDTCTQWIMIFDTMGPVITKLDTAAFYVPLLTNSHECFAEVYVPGLMLEDTCTGVKQVKAMVDGQIVLLDLNPVTGYYESHKKIKLPVSQLDFIGGNSLISYVRYEAIDSCHNKTVLDSLPLFIVDATRPVAICDKEINLTVSDSLIWLPATVFDESSWDNCGIALLLARRSDWATACGVNLCDDIQYLTHDAHDDSLFYASLEADAQANEVEAYYQQAIDGLCSDGLNCTYPLLLGWAYDLIKGGTLNCREHPYSVNDNYQKEIASSIDRGNFSSIITALIPCLDLIGDSLVEDAYKYSNSHYNLIARLFSDSLTMALTNRTPTMEALLDIGKQVGGGWSRAVPFCCEDACQSVMVELLAMDYWCNWSKCWTTVYVEDKTPPQVVCDLFDITLSCSGYQLYYAEAVEMAQLGQFDSLQHLLGSYDQVHFDKHGEVAAKIPFKTFDLNCDSVLVKKDSLIYDEHLGYRWETFTYYRAQYDTLTKTHFNGQVGDDCGLQIIEEKPWINLDACGNGFVKRIFKFVGQCSNNGSAHKDDTIKRTQTIWIASDCAITKAMFEVPRDTIVTACELIYASDGSGQVAGLATSLSTGQASYIFDSDCRQIGIGYYDQAFRIVGGRGCYKIVRTWCFADWCALGGTPARKEWWWDPYYQGKYLTYIQKIIIQDTLPPQCSIDLPDELTATDCGYDLNTRVNIEDGCGQVEYSWRAIDTKSQNTIGSGSGVINLGVGDALDIEVSDIAPGSYRLKVIVHDDCQNEIVCDHLFNVIAGRKPTPVCLSSLTVDLTPMDLDLDGSNDTAMAVVWAHEFNQSSTAACGSENADLIYRIDFDQGEPALPAKEDTKLDIGCTDTGVVAVRLYVMEPNGNWDYCSSLLIVQDNSQACGSNQSKSLQRDFNSADILPKAERTGDQKLETKLKSFSEFQSEEEAFCLYQNRPNPFFITTTIGFKTSDAAMAELSIYDNSGKLIRHIRANAFPGYQEWEFDLPEYLHGVLFYKLATPQGILVRRMVKMN